MSYNVRALVVAGGGTGGTNAHGGGGAGGMQDVASQSIEAQDYTITVGTAAQNSSFGDLIVSLAGGDGGTNNGSSTSASPGAVGGSGGGGGGKSNGSGSEGAGGAGTVGQGNAGGAGMESNSLGPPNDRDPGGGGGGGAGGSGSAAGDNDGGNGGAGLASDITGSSVTYAAGGGGEGQDSDGTGGGNQANTGNGGNTSSISGGSGIVVIRYQTSLLPKCTGGTITTSGSDTIHTFTSSGTFSISNAVTSAVTDIDFATATGNGTANPAIGVTVDERGFAWSTSTNPTILANSNVAVAGTSGVYSGVLTGLTSNTLYYVRAYFTDTDGNTTYGENVTFTTASVEPDSLYKDIDAEDGSTYAVRLYVGGTTGTVTVKLGSTGYSEVFAAGAGYVTLEGEYEGLNGLIIEASGTFDGYIDDVFWVLVVGDATIDWDLDTLTNIFPIDSSVLFRRIEDENFDRFRIVRHIDVKFKDLNAYVTVELKKEANEGLTESTKQFLVDNATGEVLPFLNKKISTLSKSQAIRLGFSNARLSETFTICQFIVSGIENPRGTFDGGNIISMS